MVCCPINNNKASPIVIDSDSKELYQRKLSILEDILTIICLFFLSFSFLFLFFLFLVNEGLAYINQLKQN